MNIEIFQIPEDYDPEVEGVEYQPGWYYWYCFPGCLPDSDPIGPYDTEQEAIEAVEEEEQNEL